MRRTVEFGLEHYPELSREGHYERFCNHLHEKYGRGGYLRLWLPESSSAEALEALRCIIDDHELLRQNFDRLFDHRA
jgi:uncharacterized protein